MWDDRGSVHNLKTGKVGQARPVERGKEGGGSFPGPRDDRGPPALKNTEKGV